MTHTPGTWEAREIIAEHDDPPTLLGVSIFADGEAIAAMRGDEAQDFANARLIAAAPELLAALEFVAADLNTEMPAETAAVIQRALNKARGIA